jgi:hypothetical protein
MFAIIIEFLVSYCLYLNGDFLFVRILNVEYTFISLILSRNVDPRLFKNVSKIAFYFLKTENLNILKT